MNQKKNERILRYLNKVLREVMYMTKKIWICMLMLIIMILGVLFISYKPQDVFVSRKDNRI